ncbi:hypothetical protein OPV22_023509 [Ensete ventricosum]|uniref:Uncharacterized protein n=1 Tax=Ensete ventricosum TaxID=4639 RepID=A0AAV8QVM9_ENSVE|nr:hypothetical protein OPV22_023509 [Ensete ventricosum]
MPPSTLSNQRKGKQVGVRRSGRKSIHWSTELGGALKVLLVTAALKTPLQSTTQSEEAEMKTVISNMLRKPRTFLINQTKIHKTNPSCEVKQKKKIEEEQTPVPGRCLKENQGLTKSNHQFPEDAGKREEAFSAPQL